MPRVADYSAGIPGAAALKRTGYVGAVRYIGFPSNRKCTNSAELRDFTEHGLSMGLVFEQAAGNWRDGYAGGRRDMLLALAHARAIGWPADTRPIYMAIDQDVVTQNEFDAVVGYLNGAASVHPLGRNGTGPYGEYDVIVVARGAGFKWAWQCRAWSGSRTYPHNHHTDAQLYQYFGHPESGPGGTAGGNLVVNGIECDTNEVLQADWGGHLTEVEIMPTAEEFWDEPLVNPADGHPGPARTWVVDANGAAVNAYHTALRVEAQLAALGGQLTENQATLLAAISDEPTQVELTGEQVQLLLSGLSEGSKAAVKEALREGTG